MFYAPIRTTFVPIHKPHSLFPDSCEQNLIFIFRKSANKNTSTMSKADQKDSEKWVEEAQVARREDSMKKSKQERRLLLKMDLSIVPLLALSFFIAYMVFHERGIDYCEDRLTITRTATTLETLESWECRPIFNSQIPSFTIV